MAEILAAKRTETVSVCPLAQDDTNTSKAMLPYDEITLECGGLSPSSPLTFATFFEERVAQAEAAAAVKEEAAAEPSDKAEAEAQVRSRGMR